jgi:hypothetical protein
MKVFVYSKKSSKKIATIKDVINVSTEIPGIIVFTTITGEKFSFDTFTMKTTIYQN